MKLHVPALMSALMAASPAGALEFSLGGAATGTVYGELNLMWLSFDDGTQSIGQLVDDNNEQSRLGLLLDWPLSGDVKLGFTFETGLGFFQSNALTMKGLDGTPWIDWDKGDIRKLELVAQTGAGTFRAGQGNMATYGVAEFDQSGTVPVGYSDYQATAGGFAFALADGSLSAVKIKDVFVNLEGDRRFRLRYDTPDAAGFTLSVATGDNQLTDDPGTYTDAALRYRAHRGRLHLDGGIGYALTQIPGEADTRAVMGSVAVLDTTTGLNAALAAGQQLDEGGYVYVKLGWLADLVPAGQTALAAEYYASDDIGFDGNGRSWGLIALQRVDALSTDLYIGYRHYALTGATQDYRDAESLVVGTKWTF